MEYCINRDKLKNIDYIKELNDFIKYDNENDSKYFREPPGIEHYNLLSFPKKIPIQPTCVLCALLSVLPIL